jgi:hypothetical protein
MTAPDTREEAPHVSPFTKKEIAWARVVVAYSESLGDPVEERIQEMARTPYSEARKTD